MVLHAYARITACLLYLCQLMHKTTPGYSFPQQDGMAQVLQSLAQLQYPHSAVAPLGYKKMYKCTINFGFIYALIRPTIWKK